MIDEVILEVKQKHEREREERKMKRRKKAITEDERALIYKGICKLLNKLDVESLGIDEKSGVEKMIEELDYIKSCFAFSSVWKHEQSIENRFRR